MTYAKGTEVSVEKTRADIERMLQKHKATAFGSFTEPGKAMVVFAAAGRKIRFDLPLPSQDDKQFTHWRPGGGSPRPRAQGAAYVAWEQACRERWRALLLCIKAKLESVESGIETFEEAFLAHVVMPGGETVWEAARGNIAVAYQSGKQIALMPPGDAK